MAEDLVHVVVVDHDGGELTLACLRSIVAADWPAAMLRVVLVDNASEHPVTDAVAAELPTVEVLHSDVNLGFTGGANLGMRGRDDAAFVALVNNDAAVSRGWLTPLVDTFAGRPDVGAACPKVLLTVPAVEVALHSPTHRRGRGDRRDLGVRVSGARLVGTSPDDGADVWGRAQLVDGFWGFEPMAPGEADAQWTTADATLRVPVTGAAPTGVALRLASDRHVVVTATSGSRTTPVEVGTDPSWYVVATDAEVVDVINNVGSLIGPDGYGADRGWLEVDRGQYDDPADVPAWYGGAVLLSRAYLDDVGLLDEDLFLYYEDIELSLRGAARGWHYRTAPSSVVRHMHSATAIEGSPLAFHYNERNHLVVATRYAHDGVEQSAARTVTDFLAVTASYVRRDVVAPVLSGARPHPVVVRRRIRAFGGFVSQAVSRAVRRDRPTPGRA